MTGSLQWFSALLVLGLLWACDVETGDEVIEAGTETLAVEKLMQDDLAVEALEAGQMAPLEESQRRVVRESAEFAALWEEMHAHRSTIPERPSVDFEEKVLVFASLGQRSTGGYRVEVTGARYDEAEATVEVAIRETRPGPTCAVTQALTHPFVLASVEAVADAEYVFVEEEPVVEEC